MFNISQILQFLSPLKRFNQFSLGLILIWLISLILRLWNLGQFNQLVFDEVYYAKFSNNYLIGEPFFHSHPPLAQYIIAIGMAIGSFFPTSPDTMNELAGSLRSTLSYRWLNAVTGSFFPLLMGGVAYQLSHQKSYGLLVAFLASLDGLFLVESRYALNNIYLVTFALLGQFFCLSYLRDSKKSLFKILLSGIFFGMTVSIKWNGLGFLLGIVLFLLTLWIKEKYLDSYQQKSLFPHLLDPQKQATLTLKSINIWQILAILFGVTIITYSLLWIPHLIMNPEDNFIEVHQKILSFHERVGGNNKETHPYCSPWYTWPLMIRPVAYYYHTAIVNGKTLIYDVHAMGNPFLWWCATLAILLLISLWFQRIFLGEFKQLVFGYPNLIILYFTLNYISNLLPWLSISRCTFLYHYMGSFLFSLMALAWILDRWLKSAFSDYQWLAKGCIIVIVASFIYWLPLYLGIPLSQVQFKIRLLFDSWI